MNSKLWPLLCFIASNFVTTILTKATCASLDLMCGFCASFWEVYDDDINVAPSDDQVICGHICFVLVLKGKIHIICPGGALFIKTKNHVHLLFGTLAIIDPSIHLLPRTLLNARVLLMKILFLSQPSNNQYDHMYACC